MHAWMALGTLAAITATALVLAIFRPARLRRRVLGAGLSMGLVPIVLWALRLAWFPVDASTVAFEAALVASLGLFLTVNGACWASIDSTPSVVVAKTLQFEPTRLVIPSEYTTDPTLQVPSQQTMYHLPRVRRQVRSHNWK